MKGGEHGKARRQGCSGDGWASRIGEATVRRFVAEGASVAFCDRDGERGQRVVAELETAGAKVTFTQADVGTEAACLDFVNGAAQMYGRLDILINNAGIRKYEKVDEASAASWNEILNVNLMSYVFCAKAAVPLMRRNKGGAIVNVASVRSVVAGGGNLQYDTTKAAVAGLTRALAADHSPDGIRVNAVGPGPIFTSFHQRRIAAAGETVEQYNAKAAQGTMLKRPGRAEEVAAAILFLASDDASYVTGALLFVDGGMLRCEQYARLLDEWVTGIGLRREDYENAIDGSVTIAPRDKLIGMTAARGR
jgi:NAD(P)-dependent dehydrogenase (short-subunit alcohol dehydrogenase family)